MNSGNAQSKFNNNSNECSQMNKNYKITIDKYKKGDLESDDEVDIEINSSSNREIIQNDKKIIDSEEEYQEGDGGDLSIIKEENSDKDEGQYEMKAKLSDSNSDEPLNKSSNEGSSGGSSKKNKNEIYEIFKKAKKGLLSYKRIVKENIEDAITNKKKIEASLENIAKKPERWRILRRRIKFLAMMRKGAQHRKIYGEHPWKSIVNDEKGMIDAMKKEVFVYEKKKERKRCLIYDDSKIRQFWSFILIWIFLYTAFITPLRLAVIENENIYWEVTEMTVNILFFIDIIINLVTVENGVENHCEIFVNYQCTWLILDVVAILPQEYMIANKKISGINKLAKVPRLLRLFRIARLFKMTSRIKKVGLVKQINDFFKLNASLMKLLQFFFSMFVVTHITGCVWLYVAKMYDYGPETWVTELQLDQDNKERQYLFSFYWAISTISTVGFGDVHAYNPAEKIFSIAWMCIGVGFYSYTVGALSSIMTDSNSKKANLQDKFSFLHNYANEEGITRILLEQLMDSQEEAAELSAVQEGTDVLFLNDVPMELRYQFAESIYNGMAHNVFLFNNRDKNLIADVIPKLTPQRVKKGEYVYKKGQHAHKVYILFKGRVHFMSGSNCIFRQFIEGSYFGEIEIFKNIPRQFAVKAAEDCELMELSRDNFAQILKDFPELEIDILRIALERDIRFKKARRKIRKFDELQSYKKFWEVNEEDKKKPFQEKFKKEINDFYESNKEKKNKSRINEYKAEGKSSDYNKYVKRYSNKSITESQKEKKGSIFKRINAKESNSQEIGELGSEITVNNLASRSRKSQQRNTM